MNASHYHKLELADKDPIEIEGLAEHCNLCRERNGKKPLNEVQLRLAQLGVATVADTGKGGAGTVDADDAMAMLAEQEEINDELRAKVKELSDENAQLRAALKSKPKKDGD